MVVETLFGSGPQLWPTLPAYGYIQTAPGTRPAPFVNAMMPSAPAVAGALSPDPAQISAGWPAVAPAPTLPTTDFATVITPQVLLAAVGMRRGQPMGPANDQEIEDFVSDALDLLAGANDVEIRCEGGRATLSGSASSATSVKSSGRFPASTTCRTTSRSRRADGRREHREKRKPQRRERVANRREPGRVHRPPPADRKVLTTIILPAGRGRGLSLSTRLIIRRRTDRRAGVRATRCVTGCGSLPSWCAGSSRRSTPPPRMLQQVPKPFIVSSGGNATA